MFVLDRPAPCDCIRRIPGRRLVAQYRCSSLPKGASAKMASAQLNKLRRDMIRLRRHLMWDGHKPMTAMLQKHIGGKIEKILARVEHKVRHAAADVPMTKNSIDLGFGSNEATWKAAIEDVLGPEANVELSNDALPIIQSTVAKAYSRTSVVLGQDEAAHSSVNSLRRAKVQANQIASINDTTRTRLADLVGQSIDQGLTIPETVGVIRDAIPEIEAGRIPTIVRTEVGRAIDEGTKQAFKESDTLSHVDVVGCTAIEPGIPTLDGVPTCNIENVPVSRIDELAFHINHTGAIVPSHFYGDGFDGPIESGGD